jgi:hypothetical protein
MKISFAALASSVLLLLLLSACASRAPSDADLRKQYQTEELPGILELKAFTIESRRNAGDENHPKWLARFSAEAALREDTFDIDTVVEGRRLLKPAHRAGENFKLYGTVQSESDGNTWTHRFQNDESSVPAIGRPFSNYGPEALVLDSPEAKALLAEVERKREQQRIVDEATRAENAAKHKQQEEAEAEKRQRTEAAVAKYKAVFAPQKVEDLRLKDGTKLAVLVTASSDGDGRVWGSDRYSFDSDFSKSVVHSGVLRTGQTGIIELTGLSYPEQFFGSPRNGIDSESKIGDNNLRNHSYTLRLLESL